MESMQTVNGQTWMADKMKEVLEGKENTNTENIQKIQNDQRDQREPRDPYDLNGQLVYILNKYQSVDNNP